MFVVLTIAAHENIDHELVESERIRISEQIDMPVIAVFEGMEVSIASEKKVYSGTVTKCGATIQGMFQSADELTTWLNSQGKKNA